MAIKEISESALGFTKSPLGIIALFIVLVYGFASLVVALGQNVGPHIVPLIYFMVYFPVLVFFGFLWLVAKHHRKLYGPSDFKDEENFLKTQLSSAASLAAAISKQPETEGELSQNQLDEIVELVSKARQKHSVEKWRNRVLWVDDHPNNNVHERQALEAQGLEFRLALSTAEAMEILKREKFALIISDMGRKEGAKEGYVLLDQLRQGGDRTPFVIYAGANAPSMAPTAKEKGALGCTNRAQELFSLVMEAINKGN